VEGVLAEVRVVLHELDALGGVAAVLWQNGRRRIGARGIVSRVFHGWASGAGGRERGDRAGRDASFAARDTRGRGSTTPSTPPRGLLNLARNQSPRHRVSVKMGEKCRLSAAADGRDVDVAIRFWGVRARH
jgi:hypothetical protein